MSNQESVHTDFGELFARKIPEVFSSEANIEKVGELAYDNFKKYYGCSQSLIKAYLDILGLQDDFWFRALGGLQAGGCSGLTCGALNAGFILISGIKGRRKIEDGFWGITPSFDPCQKLCKWFKLMYNSTVCSEISGYDWFDIPSVISGHLNPNPKQRERMENCAMLTGGSASKVAEILNGLLCKQ